VSDSTGKENPMLRVALPNKGTLAEPAATMMREAGYRQRSDSRDLSIADDDNDIEFFYLRPKDIATYVGSGDLHLGVTGADLKEESGSQVQSLLELGFGASKFRYAALDEGEIKTVEDLEGKRIATSYPRLVRAHLARARVRAEIVKLDGAVEISVHLGLADAVADVVSSGRTLRQHGLVVIGEAIAESQATLIEREPRPDREVTAEVARMKRVFTERLRGVVLARQYLMMEYDCPKSVKDQAVRITPGLQAPTISPLADESWVAVRSMVRRKAANRVMDQLAALGAKAILTTDIRSCRAMKTNGDGTA
jgi:ATP phosphoribosyltransferase